MADPLLEAIGLPFKEAVSFFRGKARVPTAHWTDVWRTAHSHSFMVAGAASDALLEDFQKAIAKALEQGTTLAEFRKDFDQIVQRHGWSYNGSPGWRSRIIYETNLSTAYSAGRYAQLNEPATRMAFPYWTYMHGDSARPRPMHLSWNGLTLRADDPFWDSHYPPNGWRCSCYVSATSRAGLGRMGKTEPDTAPAVERVPWRNPRTGAMHMVPKGIDPGFDYNPGKAWQEGAQALPVRGPELRPEHKEDATGTASPVASPEQLGAFLRDPRGSIVAGELPPELAKALGARTPFVQLSDETMEKQRERHPDLTDAEYLAIPELLAQPDLVLEIEGLRLHLLGAGENPLLGVVKTTQDRMENFLVSLRRSGRPKDVHRMIRRGRIVLGSAEKWARR